MAIDLPKIDLTLVQRWCQQRIPEHPQHQVRLEHEIRGHDVILVERRVPWDARGHCCVRRPATRSLSVGSSGGMTGLMMAALMADTAPLQGD